MTVLVGKRVHSVALANVPVVACETRMQLMKAFANNFIFCERIPVKLTVVMNGQSRTVHGLLFIFDSPAEADYISIGGRLSFTGIEALSDRIDPLDFNARLDLNDSGELTGTGRLWHYSSKAGVCH